MRAEEKQVRNLPGPQTILDNKEKSRYIKTMAAREANTPGVRIVAESEEMFYEFDQLGVNFESSDQEILDAVQDIILEKTGININEDNDSLYTVRRTENTETVYVIPKSPAGH